MPNWASPRWALRGVVLGGWLAVGGGRSALAEAPPIPTPIVPPSAPVAGPPAPAGVTDRELLQELRLLREQVNQLTKRQAEQVQEMATLKQKLQAQEAIVAKTAATATGGSALPPVSAETAAAPRGPRSNATRLGSAGARDNVALPDTLPLEWGPRTVPLQARFGPGFQVETLDSEFVLQVHNETQVDARIFGHEDVPFPSSGLYIPRERWYFMGWITKPIEYYISTNQVFGTFNLLDAFVNFHYDDRLMLKVGRFKPPFPFEFYGLSNQDLIAPERSLFAINFGPGRQMATMLWGEVLDKQVGYAVAITDGQRNSYLDFNSGKDVMALINTKPFLKTEGILKHWNVGGSLDYGIENNPPIPNGFYTATTFPTNDPNALRASPTFLQFNNNVRERGLRALWSLHTALFYQGLSLLGGWNSGRNSYGLATTQTDVAIPVQNFFVQAGYFVTGEKVQGRTQVMPLKPFDLRPGKFGLGAVEVHGRFAYLDVGQNIFTAGFADPNLWSNRAYAIDTGFNWYLNQFVKVYFDWQHAEFGQAVNHGGPNSSQRTSNLYWIRLQLYF